VEPKIIDAIPACDEAKVPRLPKVTGSIGVIPIQGTIGQRASDWWSRTSTDQVAFQIAGLIGNPSVGAVVLDIDSPGGIVYGPEELSSVIRVARGVKPIYAIANSMAASAAYWIGSAADKFFITPSGEGGSIGVWSAHQDISKAMEEFGVKTTLVSAGEFKTEGNPFEPLSDEARADMQASVDRYHEMFIAAVAAGRGVSKATVHDTFGKGRMMGAPAAIKAGMFDGATTLPELLAGIMKPRESKSRGSRVATARAKLALEEAR
jgi:signal peptide peptidase SppA